MASIEDRPRPAARRAARARAPTLLVAALALLAALVALVALVAFRSPAEPDQAGPPQVSPSSVSPSTAPTAPTEPGSPRPAPAASPALASRADLAARLREILDVRERAFGRRDAGLLETIYTADCVCLRSGRAAIARLLADRAVWRGRAIAVELSSLERLTDRIWVAVALFSSRPFRIEREDGTLIRAVPAERQRYRFVLVQPARAGRWLLGAASLLEGGGT